MACSVLLSTMVFQNFVPFSHSHVRRQNVSLLLDAAYVIASIHINYRLYHRCHNYISFIQTGQRRYNRKHQPVDKLRNTQCHNNDAQPTHNKHLILIAYYLFLYFDFAFIGDGGAVEATSPIK